MAKVNISIDDELLKRADNYADANYTSRSGLLTTALVEYLNSREMITAVRKLNLTLEKIASDGECDEETLMELEDFSRLANMLTAGTIK